MTLYLIWHYIRWHYNRYVLYIDPMISLSVTDLIIESSQSYTKLRDLLRGGADYVIDENGGVAAWGPASCQLNCKSMDFSNYPYDNHKCEFLIRSDFYPQANINL